MSTTTGGVIPAQPGHSFIRRLWDRQLDHYPETAARTGYLALTVLATTILYYELYIQGAVATKVITAFHFTFTQFVFVLVIGNGLGAFASLGAGLADRWGRANLVVGGTLITALILLLGLPNAGSKAVYTALFALLCIVEGMALVATPALIRDFSPQVGRGAAMAFWTMGPVLGSLMVTEISSHTLNSHPSWQWQFRLCGVIGLTLWVLTMLFLRELAPRIRDQLMVRLRDRALVEARASGLDTEKLLAHHWKQMMRKDIIGPAFGISVFLLLYYILVAFLVVYFGTVFGYSNAKANNLANWYWGTTAVILFISGVSSDWLRVRKPFMIIGSAVSLVGVALFAAAATKPGTSYDTFVLYFILIAAGTGFAYVAWMAAFTETVERHNPAATATGLAVWGWIIRIVVTGSYALLPAVVPATSTLVDQGTRVAAIVAAHPAQVKVLQTVDKTTLAALNANPNDPTAQAQAVSELAGVPPSDVVKSVTLGTVYSQQIATAGAITPATQAALAANPTSRAVQVAAVTQIATKLGVSPTVAAARLAALAKVPPADLLYLKTTGAKVSVGAAALKSVSQIPPADLAYLNANAAKVAKAQKDNPGQWQTWWWICFGGQVLFIPFIFLLSGFWKPGKARAAEDEHERWVDAELAKLQAARATEAPSAA
jgi:MFS family permease